MKLLLLSSEFPPAPGGIGTHAHQVATELTRLGWEVRVVTRQDYTTPEETETFNRQQPFKVIPLRPMPGAPLEVLYRLAVAERQVHVWHPDVILASGGRTVWLASWLRNFVPVPWVAVGHGTEFGVRAAWQRRLTTTAFDRADAVVSVSEFTRGQMLRLGVKPRRDLVIPNGAEEARFDVLPEEKVRAFLAEKGLSGRRLILTVGNVTERKGQEVIIRALPEVLKKVPDAHYVMAGLPTRQAEYSRLAKDLGVAAHVHFLGRVPARELLLWMNACDLFAMTSRYTADGDFEGYGIAVVEAALAGKPAVVSDNSGLIEAIAPGATGLAARENDPADTARALVELLGDDDRRLAMGLAALTRARNEQTWAKRAIDYHALLASLVRRESKHT